MTAEQIIGLSLALLVMLIGFVGCLLPGVPGTPLIGTTFSRLALPVLAHMSTSST